MSPSDDDISIRHIDGAYFLRIGETVCKLSKDQFRILMKKVLDTAQAEVAAERKPPS